MNTKLQTVNTNLNNKDFNRDIDFLERAFNKCANHRDSDANIYTAIFYHFTMTDKPYYAVLSFNNKHNNYLKVTGNVGIIINNIQYIGSHSNQPHAPSNFSLNRYICCRHLTHSSHPNYYHKITHLAFLTMINDMMDIISYVKYSKETKSDSTNHKCSSNSYYGLLISAYNDCYLAYQYPHAHLPYNSNIRNNAKTLPFKFNNPMLFKYVSLSELYPTFHTIKPLLANLAKSIYSKYNMHTLSGYQERIVYDILSESILYPDTHATKSTKSTSSNHISSDLHTMLGYKIHSLKAQLKYYIKLYHQD